MSDSQPPLSVPVQPGEVLAGKFRVERVLGAGGMGVVVAAMHLELEERVAVKFLLPQSIQGPEAAARFVREARNAVKIKGEHVARVIDVGRLDNGAPYMVMEYLEGNDLSAQLEKGQLAIADAVDYVVQACDAMAEAHALGIVHRDLKPANLFLTKRSDGSAIIKVLDFGISKANVPDTKDAGLTKTSAVMGSPYYMSPEQMKSSRDVDSRTDVWSLGVILYELISGRPPFQGGTLPELLSSIMLDVPPPLQSLRADVPAELGAVVVKVLQKDRTQRYRNVGELAAALAPFAPVRSRYTLDRISKITAQHAAPVPAPPAGEAPVAASAAAQARTASAWSGADAEKPAAPKSKTGAFVGLGAIVLTAGILGTVLGRRSPPPAAEPVAPTAGALVAAAPSVVPSPAAVIALDPPKPEVATPSSAAVSATPPVAATVVPPPRVAPPPTLTPKAQASRPSSKPSATSADKPPALPEPSPLTPPPQPAKPPKRTGLQIDLK